MTDEARELFAATFLLDSAARAALCSSLRTAEDAFPGARVVGACVGKMRGFSDDEEDEDDDDLDRPAGGWRELVELRSDVAQSLEYVAHHRASHVALQRGAGAGEWQIVGACKQEDLICVLQDLLGQITTKERVFWSRTP